MFRLMASFFYRLKRDLTFRITAIIGLVLSFGIPLIYFAIDLTIYLISRSEAPGTEFIHLMCNGQSLFVGSLSPLQNFGIAIPINLVSFIVLEFNHGTVRNKIISGHSKLTVFLSIVLSTTVLSLLWIGLYVGISTGVGSLLGFAGFDPNGTVMMSGQVTPEYIIKVSVIAMLSYILIACMASFFATLFRNIGPSIAVVLLSIAAFYLGATLIGSVAPLFPDIDVIQTFNTLFKIFDPMYGLANNGIDLTSTGGEIVLKIDNLTFISGIIASLIYSGLFVTGGALIFTKRDVK